MSGQIKKMNEIKMNVLQNITMVNIYILQLAVEIYLKHCQSSNLFVHIRLFIVKTLDIFLS